MSEATLKDIARLANVSEATVDRVIHGRGKPRQLTVEKVESAIKELNYKPNLAASQLARGRKLEIGLMLPDSKASFLLGLADMVPRFNENLKRKGAKISLTTANASDSIQYAAKLKRFAKDLDACAILAPSDPATIEAVRELEEEGVRIATLVSDLPNAPRTLFSGPDNDIMGATAGQLATPLLERTKNAVLVIKPETIQQDHEKRFVGFCRALRASGIADSRIHTATYMDTSSTHELATSIKEELKNSTADVIYLTGGHSALFVEAIETLNLGNPLIIATDLTPASRKLLIEKRIYVIVASNEFNELKDAFDGLLKKLTEPFWTPEDSISPIQVFTRFNIPNL